MTLVKTCFQIIFFKKDIYKEHVEQLQSERVKKCGQKIRFNKKM